MRQRIIRLHERWGQRVDGEAFPKFKNRVSRLLRTTFANGELAWDGTEGAFGLIHGESGMLIDSRIILETTRSLPEFLLVLSELFMALEQVRSSHTQVVLDIVREAKKYSPGINFGIAQRDSQVVVYPAGAEELDGPLVEDTLSWLADYPDVASHYEEALRIVLNKDERSFRNAFDNLRWSLEQLLRSVLANKRPIEKQQDALLPWLGARSVHQQTINMYVDLMKRFADYQNGSVKHGGDWAAEDLEFHIYLVGAFMRLLLQVAERSGSDG